MHINATLINIYKVCFRECWLHAHNIQMEHNSDLVAEGRIIEEESYLQRSEHYSQLQLSIPHQGVTLTGKIDFFDVKNKIVHETKKSNKVEQAHILQVKFYLWLLKLNDIEVEKGILEYPKLKEKKSIYLNEEDGSYLENAVLEIKELIKSENCPPVINVKICKSCSYYDFCYVGEIE